MSVLLNWVILLMYVFCCSKCSQAQTNNDKKFATTMDTNTEKKNPLYSRTATNKVTATEEAWKQLLPEAVYYVSRQKGTERPWTSKFENFKESGIYYCAACGNALFKSDTKFESGCGWPSFYQPISKTSVLYTPDNTLGMERTEVTCGRCKGHLGHVFDDGPPPTKLRYCINGVVLDFEKAQTAQKNYQEKKKD